jgi:formate hydrogenlyase subunit 6/NADH:ubiquinone oxidoreductase subunit I
VSKHGGEKQVVRENVKIIADLVFDPAKCIGCGSCELTCPTGAIEVLKKKKTGGIYYSHDYCLYCRRCAYVCPQGAIRYSGAYDDGNGNGNGKNRPEEKLDFDYQVCPSCGAEFMPVPMMEKAAASLENGRGKMTSVIALCPDCRSRDLFERTLGLGKKN